MHPRKLILTSGLVILGLTLANCAPYTAPAAKPQAPPVEPAAAPAPAKPSIAPTAPAHTPKLLADEPRYGGTLTKFSFADPGGLDPHQETSSSVAYLIGSSYSGLLQYDPLQNDKIIGDLAEKWDVSSDGTIYSFRLSKGIKFHNGKTATAQDAKYSLDRIVRPPKGTRSPRAEVFERVSKVEAPDDNTLVVTLAYPAASFMSNLAVAWNAVVPRDVVEAKGDLSKDVVGTGPFKFKSYSPGTIYEVVKFADYYVRGRPYLDGIKTYIIRDATASLAAFRTGQVMRTITAANSITPSQTALLKKEMGDKAVIQSGPGLSFGVFQVNLDEPPWTDPLVRRAANLAIDRSAAIKVLEEGEGDIGGPMPPRGPWAFPKEELLKMPGWGEDKAAEMAAAKQLMAQAGLSNGFKTTLLSHATRVALDKNVFLKEQLAKIGIDASLNVVEKAVYDRSMAQRRFVTTMQAFAISIDDPDQVFGEHYVTGAGRNYPGLSDPRIDELYAKQSRTLDVAERTKLVIDIQRLAIEDNAKMLVYWTRDRLAFLSKVKNLRFSSSLVNNNKYQDVWLAE